MTPQSAGLASPNKAGKPSLYTNPMEPLQPVGAPGDSILGGLEQSRPHRIRLIGLLGIGLASAITVGWWQAGGLVREKDVVHVTLAAATQSETGNTSAAVPKEQTAQSATGEEARTADRPEEQLPAIVIAESDNADGPSALTPKEAPAGIPPAPAQAASSVMKDSPQPVNASDTTARMSAQAAPASLARPAFAQEELAKQANSPESPATAKQKTAASADVQLAAKSPTSTKAKDGYMNTSKSAGESRNKAAEKDGDVELIAALLNRVSAKTEPPGDDTLRKPASGKGTLRQVSADQKKARKTVLQRESVAPPVTSAEAQLKRCGSLSFLESELCRIRVCEGRWGRETGCPEHSHASAALP